MAAFRLINNTDSVLAFSDSYKIAPRAEDVVGQLTLEMRRYADAGHLTILEVAAKKFVYDDKLKPDYIDTVPLDYQDGDGIVNPPVGVGGADLLPLTPAPDGSIPEFSTLDNLWHATTSPRQQVIDGGNF